MPVIVLASSTVRTASQLDSAFKVTDGDVGTETEGVAGDDEHPEPKSVTSVASAKYFLIIIVQILSWSRRSEKEIRCYIVI